MHIEVSAVYHAGQRSLDVERLAKRSLQYRSFSNIDPCECDKHLKTLLFSATGSYGEFVTV